MLRATNFQQPPNDYLIELPLTQSLGLPLLMLKPADLGFKAENRGPDTFNVNATLLDTVIDPASVDFGKSMFKEKIDGEVLVLRPEGNELLPKQVFALTSYCLKVFAAFQDVARQEAEAVMVNRASIVSKLLTPVAFTEYLEQRKREGMQMGTDQSAHWKDVGCPVQLALSKPSADG